MPGKPIAWTWFHNPRFSLTVARRRVGAELMDLAVAYGDAFVLRRHSLWAAPMWKEDSARRMALSRLRRSGVVVKTAGRRPGTTLHVSEEWSDRDVLNPERLWRQKWSGVWCILSYDIAEADRHLRDHLRRFLRRLRMGCFQRSFYISPRDIRPEYADLAETTGLGFDACLFEARDIGHEFPGRIVGRSWPWNRIRDRQTWYIEMCEAALDRAASGTLTREEIASLVREEMSAYLVAMEEDPLLPGALLPEGYRGRVVHRLHRTFVRRLKPSLLDLLHGSPLSQV